VSIGLFAWDGRPTFVPLMWPPRAALTSDAFLSLVLFVQHSDQVRGPVRARRELFWIRPETMAPPRHPVRRRSTDLLTRSPRSRF
jgi:hypothetical protein